MLPVVLLAGGLATRLRPLTGQVPKSLIDINGEPFLAHQLRLLAGQGIKEIVICTGYLGEQVREFAGDGHQFGLRIRYSEDGPTLLGTGGAIRKTLPMLPGPFFVLYGDSYLPCDFSAVGAAFIEAREPALMTVFENRDQWDTSNVEFHDGKIWAYDKKDRTPAMKYIDYGLGVFDPKVFAKFPEGKPLDLAIVYQDALRKGELAAFEIKDRFYEIGSVAGINELREYLAAHAVR